MNEKLQYIFNWRVVLFFALIVFALIFAAEWAFLIITPIFVGWSISRATRWASEKVDNHFEFEGNGAKAKEASTDGLIYGSAAATLILVWLVGAIAYLALQTKVVDFLNTSNQVVNFIRYNLQLDAIFVLFIIWTLLYWVPVVIVWLKVNLTGFTLTILMISVVLLSAGCEVEPPRGEPDFPSLHKNHWVADGADILSDKTESHLQNLSKHLFDSGVIDLIFLTVEDVKQPIAYAKAFGQASDWGEEDVDNGMVVIIRPDATHDTRVNYALQSGVPDNVVCQDEKVDFRAKVDGLLNRHQTEFGEKMFDQALTGFADEFENFVSKCDLGDEFDLVFFIGFIGVIFVIYIFLLIFAGPDVANEFLFIVIKSMAKSGGKRR